MKKRNANGSRSGCMSPHTAATDVRARDIPSFSRFPIQQTIISESRSVEHRKGGPMLKVIRGRVRKALKAVVSQHDFLLRAQRAQESSATKNPLNRFGAKYFSQADEDGITLEIVKRLGIRAGTFGELGVGDGTENNTLILLASGWRGFWIGGQELAFNHKLNLQRFTYSKAWVSMKNLSSLVQQGLKNIEAKDLDVLSLDVSIPRQSRGL